MDPAELASLVTDRTRLVVLNSPHNPCGSGLTQDDVEAIAEVAMARDLVVLSDEVYWAIRYGGGHPSVLSVDGMAERTVLLDGWSKTFAMTGWRLGFGVLPAPLVEPVTRLVVNSVSCTAAFSQHAAITALEGPWGPVEAMVASLRERRDLVVAGLNAIEGIACQEPDGAFYAFPRVADLGLPAGVLADRLLAEAGVACLPGTAFGAAGEGYLRLSYATAADTLRRALDRVAGLVSAVAGA
jgi:aspartate/methionine/tyrosine aminotransferase